MTHSFNQIKRELEERQNKITFYRTELQKEKTKQALKNQKTFIKQIGHYQKLYDDQVNKIKLSMADID